MTMSSDDIRAASAALCDWLASQEIDPHDAALVLTTAIIAIIHEVAASEGRDAKVGGQIIADIIGRALR